MKYKVLSGKRITVRDIPAVAGSNNKGTLASDAVFFATPVTATEQWVQITEGIYAGYYGAIVYKGERFAELVDMPQPDPNPTPIFPESFILSDPSGAKAEYVFVRVIED